MTFLKILACIGCFFCSAFLGSTIWMLIKFFRFTKPFTYHLRDLNIVKPNLVKQLLIVEISGQLVVFFILLALSVVLAIFSRPAGYIVSLVGLFLMIFVFKPSAEKTTWSSENISAYLLNHSPAIDENVLEQTDREKLYL